MFLLVILIFLLGAYVGSHSSKKRLRELYDENANLRTMLYGSGGQDQAASNAAVTAASPISANTAVVAGIAPPPPPKPVDNATILLYLGAFLFTSAVGLFIAFAGLGGTTRTVLTALVATGFYVLGMYLFRHIHRLKPAGLSFIAIGMILIPFVGFASYVFMFGRTHAAAVWCMTSAVAMGIYVHALLRTRHTFSVYFLLAAFLSLFMSGVAIVELPVYYFGIVMSLCGTLFMLLPRFGKVPRESQGPLEFASTILIPVSLVFALMSIEQFGFLQASAAFTLASVYYFVLSYTDRKTSGSLTTMWFIVFGDVCAITAASLVCWDISRNTHVVGAILGGIALLQTGIIYALRAKPRQQPAALLETEWAVYVVVQAAILLSCLFFVDDAAYFSISLGVLVLQQLVVYWLTAELFPAMVAAIAWTMLPAVVGVYWLHPAMQAAQLALLYLGTASLALCLRIGSSNKFFIQTIQATYAIGLSISYAVALNGGRFYAALMSSCFALIVGLLGLYERVKELWIASGVLIFVSTITFLSLSHVDFPLIVPSCFGLLALLMYWVAVQLKKVRYFAQWQEVAIFGAAAGAASVVVFGDTTVPMIADLALTAALLFVYAKERKNIASQYVAGMLGMAAFQWLIGFWGVHNVLVYSHLWAALFAFYAYVATRRRQKNEEESYTILALVAFTLPTAIMALDSAGGGYGWLLIAEQICLVLLGMAIGRRLVIKWGLVASILAVLYQLRELTFIALALVGLTIIGIAIYLLLKHGNDEKPSPPKSG